MTLPVIPSCRSWLTKCWVLDQPDRDFVIHLHQRRLRPNEYLVVAAGWVEPFPAELADRVGAATTAVEARQIIRAGC